MKWTKKGFEEFRNGTFTATFADITGDGTDDLIIACQHNGVHSDISSVIYYGSEIGLCEKYRTEHVVPNAGIVAVADFKGEGKKAVAFSCNKKVRIFYPTTLGIEPTEYIDLDINALSFAAGDLDGDGYIDLAVASHKKNGNHVCDSYIFWGGEDGINENRYTVLPTRGPHGMHSVDIGNIMNRSDSEYYISEAYKTNLKAIEVNWEATNGKKTWVKIQFRCSETADALESAPWSESFENGADISAPNLTGYIQYKLELGAYCGCGTPRVPEVTVEFE